MNLHPDVGPATAESSRRKASIELSGSELAVFIAVDDLLLAKGYAPTLKEIAERVGWKSTGSVSQYLDRLRARGVIEGHGRSLRVRGEHHQPGSI